MIKVKSSIGNKSNRVTQYEFVINSKIDPRIFADNNLWVERKNGLLLYSLKLTSKGNIHLTIGAGTIALIRTNDLVKIKIRASKILVELSDKAMGSSAYCVLNSKKYTNLWLDVMNGSEVAFQKVQNLYLEYSTICNSARDTLYYASVELKNSDLQII